MTWGRAGEVDVVTLVLSKVTLRHNVTVTIRVMMIIMINTMTTTAMMIIYTHLLHEQVLVAKTIELLRMFVGWLLNVPATG